MATNGQGCGRGSSGRAAGMATTRCYPPWFHFQSRRQMAPEPEIVSGDPHGTEALFAAMAEAVIRYPARRSFLGHTLIVPKSQRKAFAQGAKWQAMREAERRRSSHGG